MRYDFLEKRRKLVGHITWVQVSTGLTYMYSLHDIVRRGESVSLRPGQEVFL